MKILIVEDQEDLRHVVAETLRENAFAVDESADGEDALYKAIEWDYDLIILDIMLPLMDGWDVLMKIREKKNTPIMMLTALGQTPDKVKALNAGADDYLAKPFDLTELVARSKALVRRLGGDRKPILSIGDITIDTATQRVMKNGTPIDMSAREYSMCELMIRKRGEVISRSFLYEHLTDENDESMSNIQDVYVYKLRQKLGKDFIKTRRGQGYIVEDH